MRLKNIVAEDFCNYKKPSLFIVSAICDWKCCKEQGLDIGVCQNAPLVSQPTTDISDEDIYKTFHENDITQAVIIGGLEPMLQIKEVEALIKCFRDRGENCEFVIYTGYYPNEIADEIRLLSQYENIIIKFGRFMPSSEPVYDGLLGITLVSNNQFAMRIS